MRNSGDPGGTVFPVMLALLLLLYFSASVFANPGSSSSESFYLTSGPNNPPSGWFYSERLMEICGVTTLEEEWDAMYDPDFTALWYMDASQKERELYWESCSFEEKIDLTRTIGQLEGYIGMELWRELDYDYMIKESLKDFTFNPSYSEIDFSDMDPLIEWVKDSYEKENNLLDKIIDQVIQGPNPDLPGTWGARKPYGDIYSPNDRIIDDLGDEYIKNLDGSWSATGSNYGPYKPEMLPPGDDSVAIAQPESQPQSAPQPQPGSSDQICPYCGVEIPLCDAAGLCRGSGERYQSNP